MKSFNSNYLSAIIDESARPQSYVKVITTEGYDIYLTTHTNILTVTAPDVLLEGVISGLTTGSEKVTPEKGISVTGRGSVSLNEAEFTEELRSLIGVDKTVFNNKVEVFNGAESLDISDFEKVATIYLEDINSTDVAYDLSLITPQVFTDKRIFEKKTTELFKGFSSNDTLTEIEVLSTDNFERVAHDAEWEDSPSEEVGYLTFIGLDANNNNVTEVMKYWSKDATKFYGDPSNSGKIQRSVFRTGKVTATGTSDSDSATQVEEYIYIDLAVGKMVIALLTGDLYGQAGKTLPDHWNAQIDPAFVNITSFENMGFDLWNPVDDTGFHFYIDNHNAQNSKSYIATELLSVVGLAFLTDVNGEIKSKRYQQVINGASTVTVLETNDILNKPSFNRKSGDIKNIFAVRWDYDASTEKYRRNEVFADFESQARNGVISAAESIKLKAVKNNQLEVGELLKTVTDSKRSRLTNAKLTPQITTNFRRSVSLELMDVIGLDLEGFADYSDIGDMNRPFEIQSIQHDWINRTVSMSLYGATDPSSPIDIDSASTTAVITNRVGWLKLEDHLNGTFTDTGTLLTLTSDNDLGAIADMGGGKKYYYDGDFNTNGFNLSLFGSPVLDAKNTDFRNSIIDGRGRGVVANTTTEGGGYFGNYSSRESGVNVTEADGPNIRRIRRSTRITTMDGASVIDNFNISISSNGELLGVPSSLSGNRGVRGWSSYIFEDSEFVDGGRGTDSGAGFLLLADSVVTNGNTHIILDGQDANSTDNKPEITEFSGGFEISGARGSAGYGGCFVCIIKDRSNPLVSNSNGLFSSKCGKVYEYPTGPDYEKCSEFGYQIINRSEIGIAFTYDSALNKINGVDFSGTAFLSKYMGGAVANVPQVGRDPIGIVPAPTNLALTESIDTPSSPLGNISTITNNVTAPSDDNYSYTRFEFRLVGKDAYYPMTYKVANESTFEVESNGSTYEVKAQSVSKQGVLGGVITNTITVKNVLTEPAIEPEVKIPKVTGLQLKNRIAPSELSKFKSGNAEFVWNAVSNNFGVSFGNEGALGANSGSFDPYFKDYQVKIYDESNNLTRTETTKTESYTYTFDKNKVDNNGVARRKFSIEVIARGQNNQVGLGRLFRVENPAPQSVTSIKTTGNYNSIQVDFLAPNDIDYTGVNMRFRKVGVTAWSIALFVAGTSCTVPKLDSGEEYEIELTSVDAFGAGSSTSTITSTQAIEAEQVDGLSNWATELDPVDLAFIQANMSDDAIESEKIASLVASKILAGQIDVAVDIGTGVRLNGATGTVTTTTTDYNVIMGNADGSWNQLPNPTAITNLNTDTNTQTFAVDVLGNTIIGNGNNSVLFNQSTNTIDFGSNVTIGSNINQTVTVGAGGDYANYNLALEALSKIVPAYKKGGFTATAELMTGEVIDYQIHVSGVDLSYIRMTSVDATVDIDTSGFSLIDGKLAFITVSDGGQSPEISPLFTTSNGNQTAVGLFVQHGASYAKISNGGGFDSFGIAVRVEDGAEAYGKSVILTNSLDKAISMSGGTARLTSANLSGSNTGFNIIAGSYLSLYNSTATGLDEIGSIKNSTAEISQSDFSGWDDINSSNLLTVTSSNLVAESVIFTGFTNGFAKKIEMKSSDVDFSGSIFGWGAGTRQYIDIKGSTLDIQTSTAFNAQLSNGSTVRAGGSGNYITNMTPQVLDINGVFFE